MNAKWLRVTFEIPFDPEIEDTGEVIEEVQQWLYDQVWQNRNIKTELVEE